MLCPSGAYRRKVGHPPGSPGLTPRSIAWCFGGIAARFRRLGPGGGRGPASNCVGSRTTSVSHSCPSVPERLPVRLSLASAVGIARQLSAHIRNVSRRIAGGPAPLAWDADCNQLFAVERQRRLSLEQACLDTAVCRWLLRGGGRPSPAGRVAAGHPRDGDGLRGLGARRRRSVHPRGCGTDEFVALLGGGRPPRSPSTERHCSCHRVHALWWAERLADRASTCPPLVSLGFGGAYRSLRWQYEAMGCLLADALREVVLFLGHAAQGWFDPPWVAVVATSATERLVTEHLQLVEAALETMRLTLHPRRPSVTAGVDVSVTDQGRAGVSVPPSATTGRPG